MNTDIIIRILDYSIIASWEFCVTVLVNKDAKLSTSKHNVWNLQTFVGKTNALILKLLEALISSRGNPLSWGIIAVRGTLKSTEEVHRGFAEKRPIDRFQMNCPQIGLLGKL
jgi:hypothetical protein